jgi:hypothetical protein
VKLNREELIFLIHRNLKKLHTSGRDLALPKRVSETREQDKKILKASSKKKPKERLRRAGRLRRNVGMLSLRSWLRSIVTHCESAS